MELDPSALSATERYKLLIGGIVPRPIAVVGTHDGAGRLNLAPFSFFTGVGGHPMTLLFCPSNRPDGSPKDSLRNAAETGEFTVNAAPDRLIEKIAAAAEPLEPGQSEFEFAGLEPGAAQVIGAPRLTGSPLTFECRTREILRLAEGEPGGANLVLGDVVHVHVDDEAINERMHVDPAVLDLVGRMGGFGYARTRDRFTLRPGRAALEEGRREEPR